MSETLTVEVDGLRDRDDAEELIDHLAENGIRRDAMSVVEDSDSE